MTSSPSERERFVLLVHEVRSPVAALAAISEAVHEEDMGTESLRELAGLAVRATRSIDRIVGDAALGPPRLEHVDLRQLLEDAVLAAVLEGGRVRLSSERDLRLDADPIRLRQAVDNLILNAVLHSGSPEEIVVRAESEDGTVRIAVSDSGRGIDAADQERIFERGTWLDDGAGGSGLGLDLVREIAVAHGGTVTVESELGRGATFTIALPLRHTSNRTVVL